MLSPRGIEPFRSVFRRGRRPLRRIGPTLVARGYRVPGALRDDALVVVAAVLPLSLYLLREHAIAGAVGFPLDDSWIHLQFARNLAEGAGFAYNPGVPVAGSTAPLWTLLLGAAVRVGGARLLVAKLLGVACTLVAALLTRRLALALGAGRAGAREPLGHALLGRPWQFLGEWVAWLWLTNWLLPVLLPSVLVLTWWRGGRAWIWPAAALALHPLAMALLAPFRGPGFQEGR